VWDSSLDARSDSRASPPGVLRDDERGIQVRQQTGTGETPGGSTIEHLRLQLDDAALRVVVFIDDIDRLARVELPAILRLVKIAWECETYNLCPGV
jgi:hypothetical protein